MEVETPATEINLYDPDRSSTTKLSSDKRSNLRVA